MPSQRDEHPRSAGGTGQGWPRGKREGGEFLKIEKDGEIHEQK